MDLDEEQPGPSCPPKSPGWIMTFADLMALLMCFFVLLLSFSEMDLEKFKKIAGSMEKAFGVQKDVPFRSIPKGTSIIFQEFSSGQPKPTVLNQVRQVTMDDHRRELHIDKQDPNDPKGTPDLKKEKKKKREQAMPGNGAGGKKKGKKSADKAENKADSKAASAAQQQAQAASNQNAGAGAAQSEKEDLRSGLQVDGSLFSGTHEEGNKGSGDQEFGDKVAGNMDFGNSGSGGPVTGDEDNAAEATGAGAGAMGDISATAEQVKDALNEEISAGTLSIDVEEPVIIIRIEEGAAFPSGSASLKPGFELPLGKIMKVLNEVPGSVVVAGHTDDNPIATSRFRSNWELSSSRAATIVNFLLEDHQLEPERFEIRGFGATQPIVANDSPENRAKNRRVEIMISQTEKDRIAAAEKEAAAHIDKGELQFSFEQDMPQETLQETAVDPTQLKFKPMKKQEDVVVEEVPKSRWFWPTHLTKEAPNKGGTKETEAATTEGDKPPTLEAQPKSLLQRMFWPFKTADETKNSNEKTTQGDAPPTLEEQK